jgi:hypothetical protein
VPLIAGVARRWIDLTDHDQQRDGREKGTHGFSPLQKAAGLGGPRYAADRVARTSALAVTLDPTQSTPESAGAIFVEENGEGPGVRLRKAKPEPTAGED